MATESDRWSVVIPVKRLSIAKSRLIVEPLARAELALAMALDTAVAALACPVVGAVTVVTDDIRVAAEMRDRAIVVVGDDPDAGLNPALVHGAAITAGPSVVALSSDLPALAGPDLTPVLTAATRSALAAVADHHGTGTSLLAASERAAFVPQFGPMSFRAHLADGAADVTALAVTGLRLDVDTVESLKAALALGVGPETAAAAMRHGISPDD